VTQSASPGPILRSNFVGKPHLVPQNSLQVPRTRWLQENSGVTSSGLSRPRELGGGFGLANAHIAAGPSAPPWGTSCVSCSSSPSPLGPSVVTKTASHNMCAPLHEPRPEPGRGRSQASPFITEGGGKVTHDEQSYSKPTIVPKRVPLRLEHTFLLLTTLPSSATSCEKDQFLHCNQ
jgi:hypothetical protein